MRIKEAITRADALRPNTLDEAQKAAWIYELEGRLAEVRRTPQPARTWPRDAALSMPPPYDNVYTLYLCAMIDLANQETALYADDMTVFNAAYGEAIAWWRRKHRPRPGRNWRVF